MINQMIAEAQKILPIQHPLKAFVAINPMRDLTYLSFNEAIKKVSQYLPINGYARDFDSEMIDKSRSLHHAVQPICDEINGIFKNAITKCENNDYFEWWRDNYSTSSHLATLDISPANAEQCAERLLKKLSISEQHYQSLFEHIFMLHIGWSSYIKSQAPHKLIDLVAIWLLQLIQSSNKSQILGYLLSTASVDGKNNPENMLNQARLEQAYQNTMLGKIRNGTSIQSTNTKNPAFQAIFCIDTRSEGMRRHLEHVSDCETYGFAGFFAFPFKLDVAGAGARMQSPALINPSISIECAVPKQEPFYSSFASGQQRPISMFTYVDLLGPAYFLLSIFNNALGWFKQFALKRQMYNELDLSNSINVQQIIEKYSMEGVVNNLVFLLKSIGLCNNFSPIVIVCAHGAAMRNNPFQASYDCGACGGNAGLVNADVAVSLLNEFSVRQALIEYGINIPSKTRFISAIHNTTTDDIVLNLQANENIGQSQLEYIVHAFKSAGSKLQAERMGVLSDDISPEERSLDWAELFPEAGLANNAAIIIGPRASTYRVDLERRVFLHSYEHSSDSDGEILHAILSGPVMVAHWINMQYYFAKTDPEIYGAGNKLLHNVIPGVGVLEGNGNQLKIGLPWQSVMMGTRSLHEPLRLTLVIYAPAQFVNAVIARHAEIKRLIDGEWLKLVIIDIHTGI